MVWPAGEAAFVTGAAGGIGLGIARAFVAGGAKVALVDIDEVKVKAAADDLAARGGSVTAHAFDVSDPDAWPDAVDRAEAALGPIAILVNNAGVVTPAPLIDTSVDDWTRTVRINLNSQFFGTSVFLPRFLERGTRAHILNTSSMGGLLPMPGSGAYVASKFGSMGFSLVLREETRGTNVHVSVLTPGSVVTPMTASAAMTADIGGADPDRVGEQVLEALQESRFLIPTHGGYEPVLAQLHDEIKQAFHDVDDRHGPDPALAVLLASRR